MIEITDENYQKDVLQASKMHDNTLMVIDFYTAYCGPCKAMKPMIEKLSKEMEDVKFFGADLEDAPNACKEFNIQSVPTLAFIKNGIKLDTLIGLNPETKIVEKINALK